MQTGAGTGRRRTLRAVGDLLSVIGWFCFAACALLFLLWYVSGLGAHAVTGRIGIVTNPEAPRDRWKIEAAADVEVFVRWNGELASHLIQFENYCARTQVVRTDAEGRFAADDWWEKPRWPPPRVDGGFAEAIVPGLVPQYFPYPSAPPDGYTVILGPPPADSAMALAFVDERDPRRLAERDHCPKG
jgi:hypothetical protein